MKITKWAHADNKIKNYSATKAAITKQRKKNEDMAKAQDNG